MDRVKFLNFQQFASLVNDVVKRPELLWQTQAPTVHIRPSSPPEAAYVVPTYATVEAAWAVIQNALDKVLTQQHLPHRDWLDAYDACYKLSVDRKHRELYNALRDYLLRYCSNTYDTLAGLRHDALLVKYRNAWIQYTDGIPYIVKILQYLQRHFMEKLRRAEGLQNIPALAVTLWRERLFVKLQDYVWVAVADLIQQERAGQQVNRSELRDVIGSYVRMGEANDMPMQLYQDSFEHPFLRLTRDYYAAISSQFLQDNGPSIYMAKVEQLLSDEMDRASSYLDHSSKEKVCTLISMPLVSNPTVVTSM